MLWPYLGIPACYLLAVGNFDSVNWWFACYLIAAVLWTFIWWSEHSGKENN